MKVITISVGKPQDVNFDGKTVRTSIFKKPVTGQVTVGQLNIDGDQQSDLTVHGGRNKAVYVYSQDYYADWQNEFETRPLDVAQFGENLTVSGCKDQDIIIGSRVHIGTASFVVTQPRIPCYKLGVRVGDKFFPKTFWERGRLGFYLRVKGEGVLEAGDSIEVVEQPAHGITVRSLYEVVVNGNSEGARHALENLLHLDDGWLRRLTRVAAIQD